MNATGEPESGDKQFDAEYEDDADAEVAVEHRMYWVWIAVVLLVIAWWIVKLILGP